MHYPELAAERDAWILAQRPPRNQVDPLRPSAFLVEEERSASGEIVPVATIFLVNRECPWHCVMCDLWRNTLSGDTPLGSIPAQIEYALQRLPAARQIKVYNSGSFFDRKAIPPQDYAAIAGLVSGFERVIVECHPALVGEDCVRFRDRLGAKLEVAMGLETVHPQVLEKLNKRMTAAQFAAAADHMRANDIDLRVFILVQPPFMPASESLTWAARSLDFAFDCSATAATLIPTRAGNGAMEKLLAQGDFSPPTLATLESAAAYGVGLGRGRVFADLWDISRIATCASCRDDRIARLHRMNLEQRILPALACDSCGGKS
ncbi:MAG: hypothetical protein WCC27_09965 [Acidobacteriaceae bacterium]